MISLDTLQRNIGLPHWEDVVAHRVRQRGTTLREWVGQRATTLRGWVRQEVTALAKLAAPVVSCLAMFPASSPPFHPIMYFPFTHCTTKEEGMRLSFLALLSQILRLHPPPLWCYYGLYNYTCIGLSCYRVFHSSAWFSKHFRKIPVMDRNVLT